MLHRCHHHTLLLFSNNQSSFALAEPNSTTAIPFLPLSFSQTSDRKRENGQDPVLLVTSTVLLLV